MKLSDLKPDMTVYDVHSHRMGNTVLRSVGVWHVKIISVDLKNQTVMASWNGNPPERFWYNEWSKWRLKEPILIRNSFGQHRLPTREEKKAMLKKEEP